MESIDSIIFVCAGNTCRSPMAKYIMRNLLVQNGLADKIFVDSAGYTAPNGGSMSTGARKTLRKHRIPFDKHASKPFSYQEYLDFKCVIALDENTLQIVKEISDDDPENKIRLFKDFNGNNFSVDDPFYTDNFERTYKEISDCCSTLLNELNLNPQVESDGQR